MQLENLRLVKLTSSETVIAEVQSETNTTLVVLHPLKAFIVPGRSPSSFNLAMMRWEVLHDFNEPMVFNKYAIVAMGEVSAETREAYVESIKKYNDITAKDSTDNEADEQFQKDIERILMSLDTKGKVIH